MKIDDNKESVTCRICGDQCKRIYGRHLKHSHNDMKTGEYKRLYPGAPIMAISDKDKTTLNSGKHMRKEKYRKMFSEKIKGDKNPNHKSNTTELDRRSRSPFSKDFIKYSGIGDIKSHISYFVKESIKYRVSDTTLQYYINKGYSELESEKLLRDRQTTFSLEKCIEKYGNDKGYKRWVDRQEKWLSNYKKVNYSKISQEMFISLYSELLSVGFVDKVYFAKLDKNDNIHESKNNYEYRLRLNKSYILPDFFIPSLNLILEFDGTYYHRNNVENNKRERERDDNIVKSGYSVIHISEKDYNDNKELTILKLVNYILKSKQLDVG
jgi:hypothetical protein